MRREALSLNIHFPCEVRPIILWRAQLRLPPTMCYTIDWVRQMGQGFDKYMLLSIIIKVCHYNQMCFGSMRATSDGLRSIPIGCIVYKQMF